MPYNTTERETEMKNVVNRSNWRPGPWDNEDDKYTWEEQGVPCLIIRCWAGHLCGYVGLPDDFAFSSSARDDMNDAAHYEITFAGPLKSVHIWGQRWIGFDCAHNGDAWPLEPDRQDDWGGRGTYRTVEYVRDRVNRMAEIVSRAAQAAAAEEC